MNDNTPLIYSEKGPSMVDGKYTVCRSKTMVKSADNATEHPTFCLCKGEVALGMIIKHPCGQWVFRAMGLVELTEESLMAACSAIDSADSLWADILAYNSKEAAGVTR
jgi:hypothetical protein